MWSRQQEDALRAVRQWQRDRNKPVFYLAGYAGTGKTTLAKEIAAQTRGEVIFCAFTGKAALVLKRKGCPDARTIHSVLYRPVEQPDGPPIFELNDRGDAVHARLIIVDECSMVDERLGMDLLSLEVPILVLGDPAQLPPVQGAGFFTREEPDFMLTEIHRQAEGNPIIHLSMKVRCGEPLAFGRYGESEIVRLASVAGPEGVMAMDQTLVGRNVTRTRYNARLRRLRGLESEMPVVGDKLVCLKNNRDLGLLNGGLWSVTRILKQRSIAVRLRLTSDEDDQQQDVAVRPEFFLGTDGALEWHARRDFDEFTYGYALTVHKSQGSQWKSVVVFDESDFFRENRAKHLYTAITRASEKVMVVVPG